MDLLFNAPCESNTGTVCLWFHCSIPTVSLNKSVFLLLQYGVHDLLPWNQTVCLFWQAASYCSYGMHFTVMPGMLSLQLESHVITPGQHWTFQISQKHSTLNQHSTTVWFTLLMSNTLHPPRHFLLLIHFRVAEEGEGAWAYPTIQRARDGIHPGQVANQSQG